MRLLKYLFMFLLLISIQSVAFAEGKEYYTLDDMASRIQQKSGAQILSADIVQTKQGEVYRFKVKKKGRVRVLLMRPDGTRINRKK